MTAIAEGKDTRTWWAQRRRLYNLSLVAAGLAAFTCYAIVGDIRCKQNPDFEITLFTVAFQALGYLAAMAVANVCYFLGPISERLFQPQNYNLYRRVTFGLGLAFSVVLPFLVPVWVFIAC